MSSPRATPRIHAIDWPCVLAVVAIFFAHVASIFAVNLENTIRNAQTSVAVTACGFFVLQ